MMSAIKSRLVTSGIFVLTMLPARMRRRRRPPPAFRTSPVPGNARGMLRYLLQPQPPLKPQYQKEWQAKNAGSPRCCRKRNASGRSRDNVSA